MSIPSFSVKKKVTISMLTLIIILLGIISFSQLGLDLLPEIEFPTISVVTTYTGASSEDIEELVTEPMEQWISSISNVKEVRSSSKEGSSIINVEFEWGTNLDFAAQDIRETIGMFERLLPESISKPVVLKFDVNRLPILMYGVRGKGSLSELKEFIQDEVANRLERIDGVASAMVFSPEEREIKVLLKKDRINMMGISAEKVLQTLAAENLNQPAGYLVKGQSEYILRTVGEFEDLETIKNIPVGISKMGKIIRLSEVADVVSGVKEVRNYAKNIEKQQTAAKISERVNKLTPQLLDLVRNFQDTDVKKMRQTMLESIQDHWWVQFQKDSNWVDLDPTLPDSLPDERLTQSERYIQPEELNDSLLHRITIRVIIEQWKDKQLNEFVVLSQELQPSKWIGKRIALLHHPAEWPKSINLFKEKKPLSALRKKILDQKIWTPVLVMGSKNVMSLSFSDTGDIRKKALSGKKM